MSRGTFEVPLSQASRFTLFMAWLFGKRMVGWDDRNYYVTGYLWRGRIYLIREAKINGSDPGQ